MIILGIETSCDETAISLIDTDKKTQIRADNRRKSVSVSPRIRVLADKTLSQAQLHTEYGGVFPNLAKREHIKNLPMILKEAFKEAGMNEDKPTIDAVAVTYGPGLEPCLWTGINFAKALSLVWNIPVVPVNHMEGHIVSALMKRAETTDTRGLHADIRRKTISYKLKAITFPAVALLISGGHTELVLIRGWFDYKIIGQTRDDAVGEAFDKVARLLGLPYPGGPPLSALAERARTNADGTQNDAEKIKLPRPMIKSDTLDFSFSGLKTAVLYLLRKKYPRSSASPSIRVHPRLQMEVAREFENAVTDVLIAKTRKAIAQYDAKMLLIGGGVIANKHIRRSFEALAHKIGIPLFIPEPQLTTDNALMIAVAGFMRLSQRDGSIEPRNREIVAKGNLKLDEK